MKVVGVCSLGNYGQIALMLIFGFPTLSFEQYADMLVLVTLSNSAL